MIDLKDGKTGLIINISCMNSIFGLKNQDIIIKINNDSFSKKLENIFLNYLKEIIQYLFQLMI